MAAPTLSATGSHPADAPDTPTPARRTRRAPHLPTRPTTLRLLAALAGGVVLYLSFPPRPLWWLAPLAFTLLGLALHARRARAGFGYGFLFGLGFLVPLLHWTGLYVGIIAWWPLSAFEAAIMGLGGAAIAVTSRLRGAPLWAALLWVADEALRGRAPFGGLPWGNVGFGQSDGTYLSLAAIGGTPLIGLAITLTGFGLTAVILRAATRPQRSTAYLAGPVLAIVLPLVAGAAAWGLVGTDPNAGTATVAAIQGNVPRLGLDFNAQRAAVLHDHVAETEALAAQVAAGTMPHPQLVIWPEDSSDIDPYANPDAYADISAAVAAINAPVEIGAVVTSQPPGPKNTAILWLPGQGPVQQYVKRKLQPFGETMPARSFFALFTADAKIAGDFVPGTAPGVFDMGPAKVGIDICYEVAFDDAVRASIPGTNLLAVPTNNATFGHSEMTYQQLAMDSERAVEYGRSVVVAATSGVSAIIQPDGAITQQTQIFTPAALVATVPLRSSTTVADRLGSWPEWVMVAGSLVALAFGIRAGVRRRRTLRGAAALAAAATD
ncbi:MAG TPA: apolipoprotein N-acyltransferase [Sporichthyaceae bacterium]|nr:apolipoprotein N-acyltransferase [Sporichthyaceae bacterium]